MAGGSQTFNMHVVARRRPLIAMLGIAFRRVCGFRADRDSLIRHRALTVGPHLARGLPKQQGSVPDKQGASNATTGTHPCDELGAHRAVALLSTNCIKESTCCCRLALPMDSSPGRPCLANSFLVCACLDNYFIVLYAHLVSLPCLRSC